MEFKLNSIIYVILEQWAQKIIMNIVAPVQLGVPKTANQEYIGQLSNMQPNITYQPKVKNIENNTSTKPKHKTPGPIKNSMSYPPLPIGSLKNYVNPNCFDSQEKRRIIATGLGRDIEKVICQWVKDELQNGKYVNDDRIQWKARELGKNMSV